MQALAFEQYRDNDSEDDARHHLLYYFQLNKREWAAVDVRTNAVCRDKERVLQQRYAPTDKYYKIEWGVRRDNLHLL